jgi:hypothetical protein
MQCHAEKESPTQTDTFSQSRKRKPITKTLTENSGRYVFAKMFVSCSVGGQRLFVINTGT